MASSQLQAANQRLCLNSNHIPLPVQTTLPTMETECLQKPMADAAMTLSVFQVFSGEKQFTLMRRRLNNVALPLLKSSQTKFLSFETLPHAADHRHQGNFLKEGLQFIF